MLGVSQSADEDSGEVQAFLRSLIDEYGVDGLTERFRAAINEAEAGRVTGPAIQEATDWLESVQGEQVRSFTGAAMLAVTATLTAGAVVGQTSGLVEKFAQDFATASDTAAISVTEASEVVLSTVANLPTNMQVMAQVNDMFWYLINAWSLLRTPIEVVPFVLLFALAIVVTRIKLKQSDG